MQCWAVLWCRQLTAAWTLAASGDWRGRTAWPDPATLPLHAPGECMWTLCQDFYVNISTLSPNYLISFRVLKFQSLIFNCVFEAFSNALLHTSVEDFICNLLYLLGLRITAEIAEGPPSVPLVSQCAVWSVPGLLRPAEDTGAGARQLSAAGPRVNTPPATGRCQHAVNITPVLTFI